jgi:hypothetical protein
MAKIRAELFDCTLRLGGNIFHTLSRKGITDKEMRLLKAMHGNDAVVDVKKVGETEMEDREELFSLVRKYSTSADTLTNTDGARVTGRRLVERVFGVSLHDYESWLEQQVELETMEREERAEKSKREMAEIARNQAIAAAQAVLEKGGIKSKLQPA